MNGGLLKEVVEGVYWLPSKGFTANCFIVCGEKALVIDPGLTENVPRVVTALKELDVEVAVREVRVNAGKSDGGAGAEDREWEIALTHGHADHCMAAGAFAVKSWMHEKDVERVNARDEAFTVGKWFGERAEDYPTITDFLAGGDEIDLGGKKLQVMHLPGHTAGSIGFLEKKSGVLFGGDALFKGSVGRWDLPTGDKNVLRKTLERLLALDFTVLCPGHGELVTEKQRENMERGLQLLE